MRKLLTAIATVMLLLAGSLIWKAEAAMTTGVAGLAPLTKSHTPVETSITIAVATTAIDGLITATAIGPTATAITAIDGPTIVVGGISRNAHE